MPAPSRPASSRPLSPHLQIYRPQLTTVLSILHRATGIVLSVGMLYLVLWLICVAAGPRPYHAFLAFHTGVIGRLFLLGWTFCLFYHLCNGIRHLCWDSGWGFELKSTYMSGWIVVGATVVLTLVSWIAGYAVR